MTTLKSTGRYSSSQAKHELLLLVLRQSPGDHVIIYKKLLKDKYGKFNKSYTTKNVHNIDGSSSETMFHFTDRTKCFNLTNYDNYDME